MTRRPAPTGLAPLAAIAVIAAAGPALAGSGGPPAAAPPPLLVASDNPELTVGRTALRLVTRVEPLVLRLRGPGVLTLVVRANLPPEGAAPVAAPVELIHVDGATRTSAARLTVDEPADEARAFAETERYRPSRPATLQADIPEGEGVWWVEVGEAAPLGVVVGASYEPSGPAAAPTLAGPAVAPPPAAAADDDLVPGAGRGVVARVGAARALVAHGATGLIVGVAARWPLLEWLHAELSVDAYRLLYDGKAPARAWSAGPTRVEAAYDVAPVRVGGVARWRAGEVQPYLGLDGGATFGTERVLALRGAFDRADTFTLLAVAARVGAEWFFHPASGPAVAEVRWLAHPVRLSGDTVGAPPPVSAVSFELGYHLVF